MDKVIIFDTTLRDGEQAAGATLNIQEKVEIARQLEKLGVDVIEAGMPVNSRTELEAVALISKEIRNTTICGLARALPADIDKAWEAVKEAADPRIHVFLSASDIHIETTDRRLYTRFRIDGVLQELHLGSVEDELNRFRREVVSRVKILGNLDIAERRRPQDGSFRARILRKGEDTKIDFRVSVVAGYYGENVVIRILDPKNAPKSIDELELSVRAYNTLKNLDISILEELVQKTEDELRKSKHFSESILKEIKSQLEALHLSLGLKG